MEIRDELLVTLTRSDDKTVVSQRTSDDAARQSGVDFDDQGGARLTAAGRPRQNEDGVRKVTERLAGELFRRGMITEPWQVVTPDQDRDLRGDVDAEVRVGPPDDVGVVLRVQVTRAGQDLHLQALGNRRGSRFDAREASVADLADTLAGAIRHKCQPGAGHADLVLALDATDHHASLATDRVEASFRDRHGAYARQAGFQSIWLVGSMTVYRLDE